MVFPISLIFCQNGNSLFLLLEHNRSLQRPPVRGQLALLLSALLGYYSPSKSTMSKQFK